MTMCYQKLLIYLLAVISVTSCQIETAEPSKTGKIVIASDYLDKSDTLLFQEFCQEKKINIQILPLKADEIIDGLSNKNVSSEIDIVMVRSLYDLHKMYKNKLLHRVNYKQELLSSEYLFSSTKYSFVGFGIDPYIFAVKDKKRSPIKTYNDLTRYSFIDALEHSDHTSFLAPVLGKMKRVNAFSWIKKYSANSIKLVDKPDSVPMNQTVLTTLSDYKTNISIDTIYRNYDFIFPNNRTTGTFYNLRTITIVDQAENYSEANAFIHYYLKPNQNKKLNAKLYTLSIYSKNSRFRKYNVSSEKLITYYDLVDRILTKIKLD